MKKEIKELLIKISATVITVVVALTFFMGVHVNHANNMAPSLRDGDLVLVNKRGGLYADTVVYTEWDSEVVYTDESGFGRIVGMPGDVIYIDENKFTINGNVVQEYIFYDTLPGEIKYPYTVPENSYFILNDNREDMLDSRTVGAISESHIKGTVFLHIRRRGF